MYPRSITQASFIRYLHARASVLEARTVRHWMSQTANKGRLVGWMWACEVSALPSTLTSQAHAATERLLQSLHSRLGFRGPANEEVP